MQQEHLTIEKCTGVEDQCQCVIRTGQCTNKIVAAGCQFCFNHGGSSYLKKQNDQALNNYRLNKFHARLKEIRSASTIKDLRDEVGILRLILEEKFNAFTTTNEMILNSGSIGDLVMKIEKLVTSCHKLDEKLGAVIDRSTVINIAEQLIASVSKNVKDPEALERIAEDFEKIMTTNNPMNNSNRETHVI